MGGRAAGCACTRSGETWTRQTSGALVETDETQLCSMVDDGRTSFPPAVGRACSMQPQRARSLLRIHWKGSLPALLLKLRSSVAHASSSQIPPV